MANKEAGLARPDVLGAHVHGRLHVKAVKVRGALLQGFKMGAHASRLTHHVSLLILMLGNLLEKSLALEAILTATCRAMAL